MNNDNFDEVENSDSNIEHTLNVVEMNVSAMDSLVQSQASEMKKLIGSELTKTSDENASKNMLSSDIGKTQKCLELAKKYSDLIEKNMKQLDNIKHELESVLSKKDK